MGWVRSLCLSALPSTWRGNQNGYRCSSSALPISGWRFCDALSDRCFAGGSLILCVSLPGPEAVLAWSRFCRFPDGSGLYSLPGLETLLCRAHCTCTAGEICTCTADRSAPARPLISSHPLYFGVFLIKILFALAIGSRAFCTVTVTSIMIDWGITVHKYSIWTLSGHWPRNKWPARLTIRWLVWVPWSCTCG